MRHGYERFYFEFSGENPNSLIEGGSNQFFDRVPCGRGRSRLGGKAGEPVVAQVEGQLPFPIVRLALYFKITLVSLADRHAA